jgi:hypothetical protein
VMWFVTLVSMWYNGITTRTPLMTTYEQGDVVPVRFVFTNER